jgi:GntR family transcriptional regulator, rspAB operon transcriptional repressor
MSARTSARARDTPVPRAHAFRMKPNQALSRQIYDLLREQISTFIRKPYEQVSEQAIASELGVSRTPVREALARLSELGFVDIFPQSGTIIAPLRLPDLEKSQFLREALELALLRRAMAGPGVRDLARKLRPASFARQPPVEACVRDLARMLRLEVAVQKTLVEVRDSIRFYAADEAFHAQIATHAGLAPVLQEMARAKTHMDRFRHLMLSGIDSLPIILDQHIAIVEGIESGRIARAESAMQTHLRRILDFVGHARAAHPEYFEDSESGTTR